MARWVTSYLLRHDFYLSLCEIGALLGFHHATVLNGLRKMEAAMATDGAAYKALFEGLRKLYRVGPFPRLVAKQLLERRAATERVDAIRKRLSKRGFLLARLQPQDVFQTKPWR